MRSKTRMGRPLGGVIILLSLIYIESSFKGADATDLMGCFKGTASCLGHKDYSSWTNCTEAYVVIDRHLRKKIKSADLEKNLREVYRLLLKEVESQDWLLCYSRKKAGLSRKLRTTQQPRTIMLESLQQLLRLRSENISDLCKGDTVRDIVMINQMAMDPIGQRNHNQPYRLVRIGSMLFNRALDAATICLSLYSEQLSSILEKELLLEHSWVVMETYWNKVLTHRLNKDIVGHEFDLDVMFTEQPELVYNFVKNLTCAFDKDELPMGLEMFDEELRANDSLAGGSVPAKATSLAKYTKFVIEPCIEYSRKVSGVMDAIDFYSMNLRKFLTFELFIKTVFDADVNRLRTYYVMCGKFIEEKHRFEVLLEIMSL